MSDQEPDLVATLRELTADLDDAVESGDPTAIEVWASQLLGMWWLAAPNGIEVIGNAVLDQLSADADAHARAVLTALGAVAPADLAVRLAEATESLDRAGVPAPSWAGSIGTATPGRCWRWGDVFGDMLTVYCQFDGAIGPHAIAVLIDRSEPFGGYAKDAWLVTEPEAALADARRALAADDQADLLEIREIEPAEARRLIENAFAAVDLVAHIDDPESSLPDFRALALTRCLALPAPAAPRPRTEAEQAAMVDDFLAATDLDPTDAVIQATQRFVEFSCLVDTDDPLRVSAVKADLFFRHVSVDNPSLPEVAAFADVAVAFSTWAAERGGLGEVAREQLAADVELCALDYREEAEFLWLPEVRQASYVVRVDLRGQKPPVWRRLRVPGDMSLAEVHEALQVAFDWDDTELHTFVASDRIIGPSAEFDLDDAAVAFSQAAPDVGMKIHYRYGGRTFWQHVIKVEKIEAPDEDRPIACLGGRLAAPSSEGDFDATAVDAVLRSLRRR